MIARLKLAYTALVLMPCYSASAQDRTVLPIPNTPFAGSVGETLASSRPDQRRPVSAPEGAPNVLLFMADDVGFAMSSSFGGPVPTPNYDRLRFLSAGPGKGAEVVLSAGDAELARGSLPSNILSPSGGGESFDIGRDLGGPVVRYKAPHGMIEGDVPHVVVEFD